MPSIFTRLASLLAQRAEPNPVVRSMHRGRGAQGERVALGEAIWVSHLQHGDGCDSFVLAACSERLWTTGPDDRSERLPRRLE